MKNIYIIIILSLVIDACSEDRLEVIPKNQATEANFFRDVQDAEAAVIAAYVPLKSSGLFGRELQWYVYAFDNHTLHENASLETFGLTGTSSHEKNVYYDLCRGVFRSNYAIINIREMEDIDPVKKNRLIAECQFLRALYYFYQTTIFNEPPLIRDEVFTTYGVTRGNSPRAEFYAAIEKDCLEASNHLPAVYSDPDSLGRATKGAAYALAGKAFLYKTSHEPDADVSNDYEKAKEYLKKVIDLGVYELSKVQGDNPDSVDYVYAYLCNFTYNDLEADDQVYAAENNKESVFEIQNNHDPAIERNAWYPGITAGGSLMFRFFGILPPSYNNLSASALLASLYEQTANHPAGLQFDPRKYGTLYLPGDFVGIIDGAEGPEAIYFDPDKHLNSQINEGYGVKKYYWPLFPDNGSNWPHNDPTNWRLIRYSDVLLMYSEACFQLGEVTEARLALNEVRNRAGLPLIDNNGEFTKEDIIQERAVELGAEIIHFWDVVRWGMLADPWVDSEAEIPFFTKGQNEYMPIPVDEILAMDGKLKQNPGY